ncbi:MAG: hypothetical protein ABI855_14535 [Bacteroidota bacterium]
MLRYIQQFIRNTWYRLFKTEDERDEMLLIHAFNTWCAAIVNVSRYPNNSQALSELVNKVNKFRVYVTQITKQKEKKTNCYSIEKVMQFSRGPEISSIRLRMQYFLLMCLDDV